MQMHASLSPEIRGVEQNFTQFLIPFISGIALFGIGLKEYLDNPSYKSIVYFAVATIGSELLLLAIYYVSTVMAYTHRSIQIVLAKIESELVLYPPIPTNWDPCRSTSSDNIKPPEIYALYRMLSVMTIGGIYLIYVLVLCMTSPCHCHCSGISIALSSIIVTTVVIAVAALILWCRFRWGYPSNAYKNKLKSICGID